MTSARWEMLAALAAAWWVEKLVTVEWTYPYCSVRDDGPAGAVFGFPFPYVQASIVSSETDHFIPWLYVVNLVVISAGVFALLRRSSSWLDRSHPWLYRIIVYGAGAVLLMTAVFFQTMMFYMTDVWRPTATLFSGDYGGDPRFIDLRPVALRVLKHPTDCTSSTFWFPDKGPRDR